MESSDEEVQVRRPSKRRIAKFIDDEDEDEVEQQPIQTAKKIATEITPTQKRFQSEITSATHRDNHDDHDIDGSVKSIEQTQSKEKNGFKAKGCQQESLSNLIMPMSFDQMIGKDVKVASPAKELKKSESKEEVKDSAKKIEQKKTAIQSVKPQVLLKEGAKKIVSKKVQSPSKKRKLSSSQSSESSSCSDSSGSGSSQSGSSGSSSSSSGSSSSGSSDISSSSESGTKKREIKSNSKRELQIKALKQKLLNNKKMKVESKVKLLKKAGERQLKMEKKENKKVEKMSLKSSTKKAKVSHNSNNLKNDNAISSYQHNDDGEVNLENADHLVNELAIRWWYAMPEWPPVDFNYSLKLKEQGLRQVDQNKWKIEPEEVQGLKKVQEIDNYKGVFKDSKGQNYDMRPQETKPCISNFKKMGRQKLQRLVLTAYKNQIKSLEEHTAQPYDKAYEAEFMVMLNKRIRKLQSLLGEE